jgi:FkbM family methyltransferase
VDASAFDTESEFGRWSPHGIARVCLTTVSKLPRNSACRRLAFLLRKPVKTGSQPFYDVVIWGLKLRLSARGNLTEQRWLTMEQFHDWTERQALREALASGGVFFDVGANAGFYSFWVLAQAPQTTRVLAVEPSAAMITRFKHNLALNHLDSRVWLYHCAATATEGEVRLADGAANLGQSAITRQGAGTPVPGRPLLELLRKAEATRVDALKIDIEGHEIPVLMAFFQKAPRSLWPRLAIAETVGPEGEPLRALFSQHGYRLKASNKMNGIFEWAG